MYTVVATYLHKYTSFCAGNEISKDGVKSFKKERYQQTNTDPDTRTASRVS